MTADYAALGLYDPDAPHAEERLLLIEFLVGQGATIDDLVAYRDQLPGLALVIALRGGRALTLPEVVARSGPGHSQTCSTRCCDSTSLRRDARSSRYRGPGVRDTAS